MVNILSFPIFQVFNCCIIFQPENLFRNTFTRIYYTYTFKDTFFKKIFITSTFLMHFFPIPLATDELKLTQQQHQGTDQSSKPPKITPATKLPQPTNHQRATITAPIRYAYQQSTTNQLTNHSLTNHTLDLLIRYKSNTYHKPPINQPTFI